MEPHQGGTPAWWSAQWALSVEGPWRSRLCPMRRCRVSGGEHYGVPSRPSVSTCPEENGECASREKEDEYDVSPETVTQS